MNKLKVIKIGGNIVDNPEALDKFIKEFLQSDGAKILVHGGGKIATKISAALEIPTTMINGRRVTDSETLKVVTMVYAGLVNKTIVAKIASLGGKSWGVCGADANLIPAVKRPVKDVDYGFVGDVLTDQINITVFKNLIEQDFNCVVTPITMDASGQLLNTNADTIAQSIAVAMSKLYDVELTYIFEKKGVLSNIDDEDSVIEIIDTQNYERLKADNVIFDGMIPKIDNAFEAINNGVSSVVITNSVSCNGTIIKN